MIHTDTQYLLCLSRGMRLVYLPPHSPDLNPLEEAFSAFKTWLESNRDYVLNWTEGPNAAPFNLIWDGVEEVMNPENAREWYRRAGYIDS